MKCQKGFTLLEVLIAVLVLAVGLLGFAGLQLSSINNNQEAALQSQALAVANDLTSRMRANLDYINWDVRATTLQNTIDPAIDDNIYSTSPYHGTGNPNAANNGGIAAHLNAVCGAAPTAFAGVAALAMTVTNGQICTGAAANCTAKQMAAFDRWEVCRAAARYLPEGEVRVACTRRIPGNATNESNPYIPGSNRNGPFAPIQPNAFLNGDPVGDTCTPGSLYTVAVYWSPSAANRGVGEQPRAAAAGGAQEPGAEVNPRCNDPALRRANEARINGASGIEKACVLVDLKS